ncbi:MAG: hypothetical protein JSU85_00890 [Candidatus Zixiibacteriota bacterium]|nr:MAG: hypothetical protein JSU85_00890 [candidate division Zixibacteria bacterium]
MIEIAFYIRKGWPLILIFISVAAAFYFNHSVSLDYKSRITQAEQELASVKEEISLSRQRMDEYHRVRTDLDGYSHYMYTKQNPQKLMDRLKSDASQHGVKLRDIQIDVPRFFKDRHNPETVILVKFQASFQGDYYRMGRFLQSLEKRPYLNRLEELNVAINRPDGSELKMIIKGILRVFDKNIVEWCAENGT